MKIKAILKPWVLVSIGILFNILAAVITHFFIDQNNQKLEQLVQKAAQLETLIESQWRMKTELDRSQEFLLILLTLSEQAQTEQSQNIHQLVARQLDNIIRQQGTESSNGHNPGIADYDTIISRMDIARQNIINRINDTYLEKLNIDSRQSPLKQKNALLFTVAIFLQLTGLILVLSRDLKIS